jgi:hypothetical protein
MLIIEPSALCAELGSQQEELMATIARPTTTLEVHRNLKFALDNDLFLRDDFYTDENLQKFFAADRISWHGGIPTHSFGNAFTRLSIDFSLIHGTIDAEGNPVANGRKHGGGTISTTLTADSVIEVFGKPIKITNPYAAEDPRHHSVVMQKTHGFGNLAIGYRFDRASTTASLYCIFNGDGTVKGCNFSNEEK